MYVRRSILGFTRPTWLIWSLDHSPQGEWTPSWKKREYYPVSHMQISLAKKARRSVNEYRGRVRSYSIHSVPARDVPPVLAENLE